MRVIQFDSTVAATAMRDSAIVPDGQEPIEVLADDVIGGISTDVKVELGGVTVHLAMLLNPEHWEDDWLERGVEDPYEFIAGLVTEE